MTPHVDLDPPHRDPFLPHVDFETADLNHDPQHIDFVWSPVNFDCSSTPSRIGFRAEAPEINATLVRRSLPGGSAWDFSKRDTHFCRHKAVSLSRTLHFHRSFSLVYRDRLAISYRDHAHNQELTAALATIKDFADNAETNWNSSEGLRRYPITIS